MTDDASTIESPPRLVDDGRLELLERIGEGGTGVVYRARSAEGLCAVKLRPVPERAIQAARFLVEPMPMGDIEHPNVVAVRRSGREAGWYWISMPFYRSGTLADLVQREGVPTVDDALRLTEDVLAGLEAVHRAGYVHRDVKPQNVFVHDQGHAVVGDFGVARHLNANLWFRTRTGQAIGTMGYRAPEQDNAAKDADARADVYGAAATMFFLLTGRRPPLLYAGEVQRGQLDEVPAALRPVLVRATQHDPVARYPSAGAMAADVRGIRDRLRVEAGLEPVEKDEPPVSGLRRFLRRWIG